METDAKKEYQSAWYRANREHAAEYQRDYVAKNSDKVRSSRWKARLRNHGLTVEKYESWLVEQEYRCAICRTDEPGRSGTWHVDHDHECCAGDFSCGECVRGLLCNLCNCMLGFARDNPKSLRAAANYIEDWNLGK